MILKSYLEYKIAFLFAKCKHIKGLLSCKSSEKFVNIKCIEVVVIFLIITMVILVNKGE